MPPDKDWMKYLDVAKQQIPQVEGELQKQGSPEVASQLKDYLEILKAIETQYQSPEECDLLDGAYQELHNYLDTYLGLLAPENAKLFHKDDPKIILYISNTPSIRRYPKTEHYLLSVQDEDVRSDPPVWSSLAHELGHFVYWNSAFVVQSKTKMAQMNNTLFLDEIWAALGVSPDEMAVLSAPDKNDPPQSNTEIVVAYLSAWSEELFADTLGVYLLEQDYFTQAKRFYLDSLAGRKDARFKEDSDHPFPLLRPYIAAKALENKTKKSNTLWRSLKDEIRRNHENQFLKGLDDQGNGGIADADLAVQVEVTDDPEPFEIAFEDFKSAITTTIAILAEKIKSSTPVERQTSLLELIEEFKDPPKKDLLAGTKEGLAAKLQKWFNKWKKKKQNPPE